MGRVRNSTSADTGQAVELSGSRVEERKNAGALALSRVSESRPIRTRRLAQPAQGRLRGTQIQLAAISFLAEHASAT